MDFPPVDLSFLEMRLSMEEFNGLNFSSEMRDMASRMGTIVEHSEIVTWGENFGYIFRFDVVDFTKIDNEFRPSAHFERAKYRIVTRVAVSTKDGKKYLSSSGIVETTKL
jgi:hypothetical protein